MILTATRRQITAHEVIHHAMSHQGCAADCLWGFSNVKHGDHSGGLGRMGRRKKRGWRKGWSKEYRKLTGKINLPQVGCYGPPRKEVKSG